MKRCLFLLVLIAIATASCTSGLRIEKRQHRNGFYIAGISHHERRADDSVSRSAIQKDLPEATVAEAQQQQVSNEVPAETAQPVLTDSVSTQEIAVPAGKTQREERTEPVPQPGKKTAKPPYEGPADGKRLNDLFWTACIMTAVAIVIMLLVFLVPGPYFLIILASLAWFAVLAAIVMNICVAAIAGDRSKFYADKDKETSEFYRKLKRKAIWYFVILGGAIVLSYLGMLVIVLLSIM